MTYFFHALVFTLAVPLLLVGQSTLIFTRIMEPEDFISTGIAIGNPSNLPATVVLTLYSLDGRPLGNTTINVPANGQTARLASELFPDMSVDGWVEGTSPSPQLSAFWVGGDFQEFGDGAASAVVSRDLVGPIVTPNSELNLVNASAGLLSVVIRLYGADGREIASPAVRLVNGKGGFREPLTGLFSSSSLDSATHVRLRCTLPFAASVIGRDYLAIPSWSVVNAVAAASAYTQLFFPHVINGGLAGTSYRTILGLADLSLIPQNVSITFVPQGGGTPIVVQRVLAGNGGFRESTQTLFGLDTTLHDGWLRVSGTAPLTGFLAYAEVINGGVSAVPSQSQARTDLVFAHIVDLPPWMTGIALLNPNSERAEVDVLALNQDGATIGTARISIPGMFKTARLLSEWIPQTQTRRSDGGTIQVHSNIPIFGLELFFTTDMKILSGIGASQ